MTYRLFSPTELESALYNSISTTDRQTGKIFTSATKEIIKELFSRRRMKKIAEPEVSTIYDRFVKYICDNLTLCKYKEKELIESSNIKSCIYLSANNEIHKGI